MANPSMLLKQSQMLGTGNLFGKQKDDEKSTYSSSFSSNTGSLESHEVENNSGAPNSSIFGEKDEDIYEDVVRKCSADTTHDISDIETDEEDQTEMQK